MKETTRIQSVQRIKRLPKIRTIRHVVGMFDWIMIGQDHVYDPALRNLASQFRRGITTGSKLCPCEQPYDGNGN